MTLYQELDATLEPRGASAHRRIGASAHRRIAASPHRRIGASAHRRVVTSSRRPPTFSSRIALSIRFMRIVERVQRMKTQERDA